MASWRLAPSLATLRDQVDDAAPHRKRDADGTIGDRAHANRRSAHNPDERGIVRAIDLTQSVVFDAHALADRLLAAQDPRLRLVISRGRIGSGPTGIQPGVWRKYTGSNPHDRHIHVEVVTDPIADGTRPWADVAPRLIPPTFTQEALVELYRDGTDLVAFAPGLGRRRVETQDELDYWHDSGRIDKTKVRDLAKDPRLAAAVALLPWTEPAR